ncbi:MAG: DHA2 family efflux MFS transporter permease subunit [Spirochaetales bacterium]|nr:DHA2 family efflux MFS transporter permease subunit [Spirochaetales bacterium]
MESENRLSGRQRRTTMNAVKIGAFIGLLSETYVNSAIPEFIRIFSVPPSTVQWLIAGYMLVMAVLVPVSAFLLNSLTTRKLFTLAMGVYLTGALLGAAALNFPMLLTARLIQGAGTSILLPLLMNSIMMLYPPRERGRAMGAAMLIVLIAPAIGPTWGGMVLEVLSWRLIFILSVPMALGALGYGAKFLANISEKRDVKLDIPSLMLSLGGFGALVFGLQKLFSVSNNPYLGPVSFLIGAAAICLLVFRQLKIPEPMLEVRVFTSTHYSLSTALYSLTQVIMFANFVLMPLYLVNVLGFSSFQAGLAVLPGGAIGALLPRVSGILYDRLGPGRIVRTGYLILAAANFIISRLSPETASWVPIAAYCLVMSGVAVILTPSQTHALKQMPRPWMAHGTAVLNTLALVGASIGGAVYVGLMGVRQQALMENLGIPGYEALAEGINFAYLMITFTALTGCVIAQFLRGDGRELILNKETP